MEGRWNVWNPWYLMLKDKPRKDVSFVAISFHTVKIKCSSIWTIDGNGWTRVTMCSRTHPWVNTLFAQYGRLVLPPLNDIEVLAHFLNEQKKTLLLKCQILKWKSFISTFQVEGAWICTSPKNSIEGPNISTKKTFEPFDKFYCLKDWIQLKNKIWTRSGQFSFMKQTSLSMLYYNSYHFFKFVKATFES
jgi:hypothetical protein